MEPAAKKTKLTDHFRVALKPRDLNVALSNNNNNKQQINLNNVHKQNQPQASGSQAGPSTTGSSQSLLSDTLAKVAKYQAHVALKETRSSRENLQLQHHERQQRQQQPLPVRRKPQSPIKRIEIITIDDADDQATAEEDEEEINAEDDDDTEVDDEATEIEDEDSSQNVATTGSRQNTKHQISELQERIHDYDLSVLDNVLWEPHYACDSFEYDRKQELKFLIDRRELDISPHYRAQLVDWLINLQVRFSLDHEPLYMAVKLADLYLAHKHICEEQLILLYLTTMFISAKFDERQSCITMPVLLRQARVKFGVKYTIKQIINLEVDLLTTLDFNLRFPLSYGFLRRFARCTRSDMRTINLARYILESSLMDYDMIEILESEIAAGSLLLAHEMLHHTGAWNATARHYTGYEERQLFPLIIRLNRMLLKFSRRKTAVRRKYSHELFMEVANIPPMLPELLRLIASECEQTKR